MGQYFIINGRVIDPKSNTDAKLNVYLAHGKVADITKSKDVPEDAEVIDAEGMVVAPGFIDMHAHLREPGFEYKEDIESGSLAAAAGGFTSVCCMPNTNPINDNASVTEYIIDRARAVGLTNIFPIGSVSRGEKGEGLSDIGDMAKAGIVAISDDGCPVTNSGLMRRAMEYATNFGLPVISHCEDLSLRGEGVMHEGAVSTELGLRGISSAVEDIMVARDIMLSEITGAPLHIAHVSTKSTVRIIRCAKERGVKVSAEVTPHHLALTDAAVADYDPNTKVNPPLRTEEDRHELIRGLADGTIDAIATDHAPHNITDKEMGFQDAAFGMIGLETALPLALKLWHDKKVSLKRIIEALTYAPARVLNLNGKGVLAKGSDADVTIFDPNHSWTILAANFASKSRNTPFDGTRVLGKVKWTITGGRVVFSA